MNPTIQQMAQLQSKIEALLEHDVVAPRAKVKVMLKEKTSLSLWPPKIKTWLKKIVEPSVQKPPTKVELGQSPVTIQK